MSPPRIKSAFKRPTAAAADALRKDVPGTVTLAKLLSDFRTHSQLCRGSVIVLDEAGAVGLNDMAALFNLASKAGCRVVFSGDTGQHTSVAHGDALRILEQYSGYRFSELTTIRRQKLEAFRQVVELAAAKETDKAFARLLDLGAVTEAPTDRGELYQRAADVYLSATQKGKSALLVSPTWAEIGAVTEKVRDTLKAQNVLSQQDESVTVFDSFSWTEAQKKNRNQYEPGQRLRFVRRMKHFDRGETVEVQAVLENGLRVRRADGCEIDFIPANAAASFDVGEPRELKIAAGDWLLLQANAVVMRQHFINGERVQVREIRDGRIGLADGRVLPADYNTFTHGYAVTSHSSQGKTVDEVLLVASSKSFPAVNREQFYVSISRGRERVHVFTDDSELLARRVTDTHERKAAIELQALRDGLASLGFVRREGKEEKNLSPVARQDFRTMRPMREITRVMRFTRLAPVQRLAQTVEQLRRWIGEILPQRATPRVSVGESKEIKQTKKITPAVTQTPETKLGPSLQEQLREKIEKNRQSQQQNRSRGIRM